MMKKGALIQAAGIVLLIGPVFASAQEVRSVDWEHPEINLKELPKAGAPAAASKPVSLPSQAASAEDKRAASDLIEITAENFDQEVAQSKVPVFIDIFATWCGPCKIIAPLIDELAARYKGKVKFGRIDVDQQEALAHEVGIRAMPTFILFKNGQEVKRLVGISGLDQAANRKRFEDAMKTFLLAP